jgi:hypothetical protein
VNEDYYQEEQRPMPFISPVSQVGSAITTLTDPTNDIYKLNELGISSVLSQTQGILNTITSMSNLKNKNEVVMMMDFLADTLAKDLMMNRLAYNITSPTARDKIYFMVLAPAYMHLNRPLEEGEKRFWKGTVQEIKQTLQSNNTQPGFFQKLLGHKQ